MADLRAMLEQALLAAGADEQQAAELAVCTLAAGYAIKIAIAPQARERQRRRNRSGSAAPEIGFGRYVISATTPFSPADLAELRTDAPAAVRRLIPDYEAEYARRGWRTPSGPSSGWDCRPGRPRR